jgi:hypothetical protein
VRSIEGCSRQWRRDERSVFGDERQLGRRRWRLVRRFVGCRRRLDVERRELVGPRRFNLILQQLVLVERLGLE